MLRRPVSSFVTALVCGLGVGSADGASIISQGADYSFVLPNPPYNVDTLCIQIVLRYEDSESAIGDQVWLTGPGVFDLSSDPDMSLFLSIASNGLMDDLSVDIMDAAGARISYVDALAEPETFGRPVPFTDIAPLEATGIQLCVWHLSPAGGLGLRWEVLGVPEPTTGTAVLLGAFIALLVRHRRCPCGRWAAVSACLRCRG